MELIVPSQHLDLWQVIVKIYMHSIALFIVPILRDTLLRGTTMKTDYSPAQSRLLDMSCKSIIKPLVVN